MTDRIDAEAAEERGREQLALRELIDQTTAPEAIRAGVDELVGLLEEVRDEMPEHYQGELTYSVGEARRKHAYIKADMYDRRFYLTVVHHTLGQLSPALSTQLHVGPDDVFSTAPDGAWNVQPAGGDVPSAVRRIVEDGITGIVQSGGIEQVRAEREAREAERRESDRRAQVDVEQSQLDVQGIAARNRRNARWMLGAVLAVAAIALIVFASS